MYFERMPTATTIDVNIPGPLRVYCGNASSVAVSGGTVREALADMEREMPALYVNVCDETGAVRKHIGVFVNEDHIRDLNGLDSRLESGDVLTILPAVSGG